MFETLLKVLDLVWLLDVNVIRFIIEILREELAHISHEVLIDDFVSYVRIL